MSAELPASPRGAPASLPPTDAAHELSAPPADAASKPLVPPSPTPSPPATSPAPLRPRRVVVASSDTVKTVVDAVRAHHPGVADGLLEYLQRNVRTLRDDEIPVAAPDAALAAEVAALEVAAQKAAAEVQDYRQRNAGRVLAGAREVCRRVSEGAVESFVEKAVERAMAGGGTGVEKIAGAVKKFERSRHVGVVGGRIAKLGKTARQTKLRARNLVETLKIIAENAAGEKNDTVTLTMDGVPLTLNLLDLDELEAPEIPESPDIAHLRRVNRASLPGDPAMSPHITPRTRRRLLCSPAAAKARKPFLPR